MARKELTWQFKVDEEEAPQIEFFIYVDEFASSTFELVLWANGNTDDADQRLICYSFVSMNKFCSSDISVLAEMENFVLQEARLHDRLWQRGVVFGGVKGEFIITNTPYLRQMIGGIRTEEGIQTASVLYVKKDKYGDEVNPQIKAIIQINIQLDELTCKLNQKELTFRVRQKITEQLQHQVLILKEKIKESTQLYKNEMELIQSQMVITDLAKNLVQNADLLDEKLREMYYEVLCCLLLREEFYLNYMGFGNELKDIFNFRNDQQFKKNHKMEMTLLHQKLRVGLLY